MKLRLAVIYAVIIIIIGAGCKKNLPTVDLTNPADGSFLSGTVSITAEASDKEGVNTVFIAIDDTLNDVTDSESLGVYTYQWNTTALPESTEHTIYAMAYDFDNNQAVSDKISVTVANHKVPPIVNITNPVNGAVVSGMVDVTAEATDNIGVVEVDFYLDDSLVYATGGLPYVYQWNTNSCPDSSQHAIYATAIDTDSNTAVSDTVVVTVMNYNLPPVVQITSPANGSVVSGTVDFAATASDSSGIAHVDFYINDTLRFADDMAPYLYQWSTNLTPDSTYHTLYARAYDNQGKDAVSETITVMVDNSGQPHNIIRLVTGIINAETLSVSDPRITVQVNAAIIGQVELQTVNLGDPGWVAPLAGTPSWGTHSSSYWGIHGWIPTGIYNHTAGINLTAPSTPGQYYIYFAWGFEMGFDDVMSLTSWQYPGGPVWNDGVDVADWNDSQAQQAIVKGYVFTNYLWGSGDYGMNCLPGTAIRVTVNP